jgi:hypothetical protein
MDIFFACVDNTDIAKDYFERTREHIKINILFSYYYVKDNVEDIVNLQVPYTNKIMLDSGAFTLFSQNKNEDDEIDDNLRHEIKTLNAKYMTFLKEHKKYIQQTFCNVFSLDYMKNQSGFEENQNTYMDLREIYPDIVPVVHEFKTDDDNDEINAYFHFKPKTISIGQIENRTSKDNRDKLKASVDKIKKHCSCHLLGISDYEILKDISNIDTCDSQSWLKYATTGQIMFNKVDENGDFVNYIVYFPKYEKFKKKGIYYNDWVNENKTDSDIFRKEMEKELKLTRDDFFGNNMEQSLKLANIYYQLKMIDYLNGKRTLTYTAPQTL